MIKLTVLSAIVLVLAVQPAHAGKWRTGEGATIEGALRNAIDKLEGTRGIRSIDSRSKGFKTICKETGVLYRIRMHGNYHSDGSSPGEEWIKREAARLLQHAKVCPITRVCRRSLRENITGWRSGTVTALTALTSIETDCKVPDTP
jgi:hypothetical protein